MDTPPRAAVLLEAMETRPDATAHAVAAGGLTRGGAFGLAESERLLAHEHQQCGAGGAHE